MLMENGIEERILDANDRCDKCGSRAYFLTVFGAGELSFCGHHFRENEIAIREFSYHISDQSKILESK